MNAMTYLNQMQKVQSNILVVIESESDKENKIQDFISLLLNEYKIQNSITMLNSFLHLILQISKNHHHTHDFFSVFEKIILAIKDTILKYYTNYEIFKIFKSNKRILLYLIKSNIITIDKKIIDYMKDDDIQLYFFPEIKEFLPPEKVERISKKIPENFDEKRLKGENDSYISNLIINDSIDEFISYSNQVSLSLSSSYIKRSIFESNYFLQNKFPKLIEYAAFCGSIQIFQYLRNNNVSLTNSLWLYAIHSQNAEIISILEENKIIPKNNSYLQCFEEAVKCHHNDIADYILTNYLGNNDSFSCETISLILKCYNFQFIKLNYFNLKYLCELCQFDYLYIVELLVKNANDTSGINCSKVYPNGIFN